MNTTARTTLSIAAGLAALLASHTSASASSRHAHRDHACAPSAHTKHIGTYLHVDSHQHARCDTAGILIIDGRHIKISTRGSVAGNIRGVLRDLGYRTRRFGSTVRVRDRSPCGLPRVSWIADRYGAHICASHHGVEIRPFRKGYNRYHRLPYRHGWHHRSFPHDHHRRCR